MVSPVEGRLEPVAKSVPNPGSSAKNRGEPLLPVLPSRRNAACADVSLGVLPEGGRVLWSSVPPVSSSDADTDLRSTSTVETCDCARPLDSGKSGELAFPLLSISDGLCEMLVLPGHESACAIEGDVSRLAAATSAGEAARLRTERNLSRKPGAPADDSGGDPVFSSIAYQAAFVLSSCLPIIILSTPFQ